MRDEDACCFSTLLVLRFFESHSIVARLLTLSDDVKTISCLCEDVDEVDDEAIDRDEDDGESTSRWFSDNNSSVSDSTSSCFIIDLFLSFYKKKLSIIIYL